MRRAFAEKSKLLAAEPSVLKILCNPVISEHAAIFASKMPTRSVSYKRSQIEQALWQVQPGATGRQTAPPKRLLGRIKKLLDVDRTLDLQSDQALAPRAFSEDPDLGQGTDAAFTPFNVYCLALALDLLDVGFKQSEIVSFFRHARGDFEVAFRTIGKTNPILRLPVWPMKGSSLPTQTVGGVKYADYRHYVVLNRIELTEAFVQYHRQKRMPDHAMMFAPRFYAGIEALAGAIDARPFQLRRCIIIELTDLFEVRELGNDLVGLRRDLVGVAGSTMSINGGQHMY